MIFELNDQNYLTLLKYTTDFHCSLQLGPLFCNFRTRKSYKIVPVAVSSKMKILIIFIMLDEKRLANEIQKFSE